MWDLFQVMLSKNVTPNQVLLMFGMKNGVSTPAVNTKEEDKLHLVKIGYLDENNGVYSLTPTAKAFCIRLDNYFIKAKKKTDIQLMGKKYVTWINDYREIFPNKKLPSGKPARNNVKALGEAFRWFFNTYEHDWATVFAATKMYVNEYRDKDYMYMQTSQYFICKQDKHRVKHSTLADYCDMIIDGIDTEEDHFKENVV
tara:strand:+ start:7392 stop:7988 length:597 start_codon:yes stop_codon:yes gene_type:complete